MGRLSPSVKKSEYMDLYLKNPECFLWNDPENPHYPVCGGDGIPTCHETSSAFARARILHKRNARTKYPPIDMMRNALIKAKKLDGCQWNMKNYNFDPEEKRLVRVLEEARHQTVRSYLRENNIEPENLEEFSMTKRRFYNRREALDIPCPSVELKRNQSFILFDPDAPKPNENIKLNGTRAPRLHYWKESDHVIVSYVVPKPRYGTHRYIGLITEGSSFSQRSRWNWNELHKANKVLTYSYFLVGR